MQDADNRLLLVHVVRVVRRVFLEVQEGTGQGYDAAQSLDRAVGV